MKDDFKQIKRSKASQSGRKSFGEEWSKETYTGRAFKGAMDAFISAKEHLSEPAYRPGKGDKLTTKKKDY